ncbi:substrate-binding domain-containing protein [Nakamurella sp. GG22]
MIGYDNSALAKSLYLDLTSIEDRSDVVGAAAGRALLARFEDQSITAWKTLIEPGLVIRSTTATADQSR